MNLAHRIAHWLGWNTGRIETWTVGSRIMVGFRCSGCERLSGIHDATRAIEADLARRAPAAPATEGERP